MYVCLHLQGIVSNLVQEWLDMGNVTVVVTSSCRYVCAWWFLMHSCLSPSPQWSSHNFFNGLCLMILSGQWLSLLLAHPFLPHSPSTQLSINMFGYSTLNSHLLLLWPFEAEPPCGGCQWMSSNECLHNCQLNSPHDCELYWTRLRDH